MYAHTRQYAFPPDLRVSKAAKDFVQRLLVKDARKRMTAHEALNHPFLFEDNHGGAGGPAASTSTLPCMVASVPIPWPHPPAP